MASTNTTHRENQKIIRVAVIGAGAAGLCAARHLLNRPNFSAVVCEKTDKVGGTWVYNENTGVDSYGLPMHSSIYRNLRVILPKELMAFPDLPFREGPKSFVGHEKVLEYLDDYAQHFDLHKHIRFNTLVERVTPLSEGLGSMWQVEMRQLKNGSPPEVMQVDAVIVANGHYSTPWMPEIPSLDDFSGKVLHSHYYRQPEDFKDQVVLCLGAGPSGIDISIDISKFATKVYLTHWNPALATPLPSNVQQTCNVKKVIQNGVQLQDDTELQVDTMLLCTGYKYDFPFLSPKCRLSTEGERVTPLYKHLIHIDYPTLSFIGLCKQICTFPQFHCQVLFVIAALDGSMKLPTAEEMTQNEEADYNKRLSEGLPHRHAHNMGARQWAYNDELAALAGFGPIPRVLQKIWEYIFAFRQKNALEYHKINVKIVNPEEFIACFCDSL